MTPQQIHDQLITALKLHIRSASFLDFEKESDTTRVEANKVRLEIQGTHRPDAKSRYAKSLIDIARVAWRVLDAVPGPTGPPAPAFKRVAPITVTQEGASDQRVCLFNPDGSLRPGVTRLQTGEYTDESGAKYNPDGDGLENSGVRTKLPQGAFGLVTALQMNGRSACQCPTSGDPSKNTGSWTV
jgi:hypothetical protein